MLHANPTRIMPLGDSITYGQYAFDERPTSVRESYRSHLYHALIDANYTFDFVGSQTSGEAIQPPFDPHNEGHPGWTSHDIAERIHTYMNTSYPDTILLHIGTNDHSTSTRGVESILNEIDQYERDSGKKVLVLVALIIDRQAHDPVITAFNHKVSSLISLRRESGDIVTLVNMQKDANLNRNDYIDNTHPNDDGYKKMSAVWLQAIQTPYKAFNISLSTFPYTLVDNSNIISIHISEEENSVEFRAEIPDSGITF